MCVGSHLIMLHIFRIIVYFRFEHICIILWGSFSVDIKSQGEHLLKRIFVEFVAFLHRYKITNGWKNSNLVITRPKLNIKNPHFHHIWWVPPPPPTSPITQGVEYPLRGTPKIWLFSTMDHVHGCASLLFNECGLVLN